MVCGKVGGSLSLMEWSRNRSLRISDRRRRCRQYGRVFDFGVLGQAAKQLQDKLVKSIDCLLADTKLRLSAPAREQDEAGPGHLEQGAFDVRKADLCVPSERLHLPKPRLVHPDFCVEPVGGGRCGIMTRVVARSTRGHQDSRGRLPAATSPMNSSAPATHSRAIVRCHREVW